MTADRDAHIDECLQVAKGCSGTSAAYAIIGLVSVAREQASEIAALRRRVAIMQQQLNNHNQDVARRGGEMIRLTAAHPDWPEDCRKGIVDLLFDNAALRLRVATYGQHKMDCVWHWHRAACDCGFEAPSPPAEERESGTP
jgi:hypothetical protein